MMATLSKKQKKVLKRILISAGLLILIKLLPLTGWRLLPDPLPDHRL